MHTRFSRRPTFAPLLLVLLLGLGTEFGRAQPAAAAGGAASERPNIVLLMADDLGWGDVGFNGGKTIRTPHLDEMAAAGLRFRRFYAAAPVCSPTRGSCLTGRHPYRYGVYFANTGHLRAEEKTLAELLRELGYTTGHFGKWHLGTLAADYSGKRGRQPAKHFATPGMNGFDEWFSTEFAVATWDPYDPANSHVGKGQAKDTRALYWHNGKNVEEGLEGDDSRIIMDKVIPFVQKAARSAKPFFAVVWFHAPHAPVVGGPRYRAMYSEHDEDAQHYYACVTALDEQVGRLRRELRTLGAAKNTMLWFCSDNGPEGKGGAKRFRGSAGPFRGRKRSLFEGGVRVPGLLEWPGKVEPGSVTDYPAVTSDYLPTIVDVLGVQRVGPEPIDGVSLLPMLEGEQTERPSPIGFRTRGSPSHAWSGNRYKLLSQLRPDGKRDLLFDLVADPAETRDLAAAKPEVVKRMKAELQKWRDSCDRSDAGGDYGSGQSSAGAAGSR